MSTENDNHNGNGSGNGHDNDDDDDNVVHMPTLAERDKMRRQARKEAMKILSKQEPMIRLPIATKALLGILLGIFITTEYILPADWARWALDSFGFTPGSFTGADDFQGLDILTPFTYMFFHANWLHIGMNGVMFAAFGSGVERWLGAQKMVAFFVACSLFGALAHFLLYSSSTYPVIGASGGLSGMFAAALVMLNQGRQGPGGRIGIMPFVIIWIGITVVFGMMGSPDGGSVAWAAHVGGFLGGFVVLKAMRVF